MLIEDKIRESIAVKEKILQDREIIATIAKVSEIFGNAINDGGKLLFCGNGGSAADSQHIVAEFMGRFQRERRAIPAISLNSDTILLTAIANDYGYEMAFLRAVEGLMRPIDILIGISTSGNSENIYRALLKAKEVGGTTVAFLGKTGGKIKGIADYSIVVPSDCTARIQECHIMIGHILCEIVESNQ